MAEKKPGKKLTQTMDAFGDERPAPPVAKGGRVSDSRGLAAFDKAPSASSSHAAKGSSRWGGGGSSSAPPASKKPEARAQAPVDDNDDLRHARLDAHEIDDDGMVAVSSSGWGDDDDAREEVAEETEYAEGEAEEAAPAPRKSNAWKWIVGGVLVCGAGGAAAAVILTSGHEAKVADGTQGGSAPATHARPDAGSSEGTHATATTSAGAGEADADGPTAASDAGPKVASAGAAPAEEVPTVPATWAPDAEAKNAWVNIAAAPENQRLGLSDSEANDSLTSTRTGFRPEAKLTAPTKAYRLQAHEVSWGELQLATTIPEVATFARPEWLPKNPERLAALPATGVPWTVARAYCRGLMGDLPSEAEWEWAARGADDRYFPWGREALDSNDVHIFASGAVPVVAVATAKLDRTPEPVLHDLLGNAQEWTRDAWRASDAVPPAPKAKVDPKTADPKAATHKAVRGWPLGRPGDPIPAEGSTYRAAACADPSCLATEAAALARIGFRCMQVAP